MLKNFVVRDGDKEDVQVGTFSYDSTANQFAMTINKDIPVADLPLSLEGFANKNKYILSHSETLRWVRGRVCPPGRHNMRDILKENGLKTYDEFSLLMLHDAKCGMDGLYLEAVDEMKRAE